MNIQKEKDIHQASKDLLPARLGYSAGALKETSENGIADSQPCISGKIVSSLWKKSLLTSSTLGHSGATYEHISFFTGHSFAKAAELAGLRIDGFELTPIHGRLRLLRMLEAAVHAV